jgi:hypothetical protein
VCTPRCGRVAQRRGVEVVEVAVDEGSDLDILIGLKAEDS